MPQRRPGSITIVCVLAIVLGAMGVLAGAFGTASLAFQDVFQKMQNANAPPEQQEMYEKMMEAQAKWNPFMWFGNPANVIASLLLFIGGIRALSPNDAARRFLVTALIAAVAIDVLNAAIGFMIQAATIPIMQEAMEKVAGDEPGAEAIGVAMKFGILVGLVVGVGVVVLKLVYYIISFFVMKKPSVTEWYNPPIREQPVS